MTTVERMGVDGDGVVRLADGGQVFLPYVLAGEVVEVVGTGRHPAANVVAPSADRIVPACRHFGVCGGCSLQHWREAPYVAWKAGLIAAALERAGFAGVVPAAACVTEVGARRRVDLALRRQGAALTIGLHAARSQDLVDLVECPILHPLLFGLIAPLRGVVRGLAAFRREGSAVLNLLDTGPDLLLRLDAPLTAGDRTRLAAFAAAHGVPRIATAVGKAPPETACLLHAPYVAFAGVKVVPPPGAFLQASEAGEQAIVAAVMAGLPGKLTARSRVVELYAGCGTLTFPLAQVLRVAAFEGERATAAALIAAVNAAALAGRITAMERDLARQPLSVKELAGAAAIVLNPPHAGAAAQMAAIAASGCARVIYVSCNPATLSRDAEALHAAGYRLLTTTPIDQFRWSARVESVSVFERQARFTS